MKTTIFTTVQLFAQPHKQFGDSMLSFIKNNDIDEINVFVSEHRRNPRLIEEMPTEDSLHWKLEKLLTAMNDITTVNLLFDNTQAKSIKLKGCSAYHSQILPQAVNPVLGLTEKLPSGKSTIINGCKIRLHSVPSIANKSRLIVTTGALTMPTYNLSTSQGSKALQQHQNGFAVHKEYEDGTFQIRPVYCDRYGGFQYGKDYYLTDKKLEEKRLEAMVLGDIHEYVHCKKAIEETKHLINELKPKRIFVHDFFDGKSINPHDMGISGNMKGKVSIKDELISALSTLKDIANIDTDAEVFIVYSNHDDFLFRHLESGAFTKDMLNLEFCCRIIKNILVDGEIALKAGLKAVGIIPSNVKFLGKGEDMTVKGYTLSLHGDKGVNGAKGSVLSYEKQGLRSISGHTHSPLLLGKSASVGHLTDFKKQRYAHGGISSWLQANMGITATGQRMMLILKSNWK